ncbi:hypothetical protein [Saccharospirillum impatiens]|jgi:hypothetical protein|uniref:hypothetical protein n=1 Tax=Saccharospirillum impatiens TaxID=169438 RepID=UPI000409984E|nr:hypothetical protein [Saccharospirillum impatiens]
MYNTDLPSRNDLPSSAQLLRSTLVAAVVAVVLLVTIVMPAEYAIDPTGAGRLLGLTEMGEIKEQLAEEAAADEAAQLVSIQSFGGESATQPTEPPSQTAALPEPSAQPKAVEPALAPAAEPEWQDQVRVVLAPGEGAEFKLTMEEGAVARFSWVSVSGPINYDTHGDGNGQSISYEKGRDVLENEGELRAAFTGNHGWFFRNRNSTDITLVLRTYGDYGELKRAM